MWETSTCALIASTITTQALHFVAWDPQAFNEFITVGDDAAIMFWLVDELTDKTPKLRVQEPKVPEEIIASAPKVSFFKELKIEQDRKLLHRKFNKQRFSRLLTYPPSWWRLKKVTGFFRMWKNFNLLLFGCFAMLVVLFARAL